MSTTVKAGWLKDNEGNKFAPKTISSQVYNNDGVLLSDQLDELSSQVVYQSQNNENITVNVQDNGGGSSVILDTSLSLSGYAADAKVVGDTIGNLTTLKTSSKSNIVNAINELATTGGTGTGASGDCTIKVTPTVIVDFNGTLDNRNTNVDYPSTEYYGTNFSGIKLTYGKNYLVEYNGESYEITPDFTPLMSIAGTGGASLMASGPTGFLTLGSTTMLDEYVARQNQDSEEDDSALGSLGPLLSIILALMYGGSVDLSALDKPQYPFALITLGEDIGSAENAEFDTLFLVNTGVSECTLRITEYNIEIEKPLDDYLQADHLQFNKNHPGYIKNKIAGIESKNKLFFDGKAEDFTSVTPLLDSDGDTIGYTTPLGEIPAGLEMMSIAFGTAFSEDYESAVMDSFSVFTKHCIIATYNGVQQVLYPFDFSAMGINLGELMEEFENMTDEEKIAFEEEFMSIFMTEDGNMQYYFGNSYIYSNYFPNTGENFCIVVSMKQNETEGDALDGGLAALNNSYSLKATAYTNITEIMPSHEIKVEYADLKKLDKKFLPNILENDLPITALTYTKSVGNVMLRDQVNGYEYLVISKNGTLETLCRCASIAVTTNPSKTSYAEGDYFNPAGMVVKATRQDGSVTDITSEVSCGYTSSAFSGTGEKSVTITYREAGHPYTATVKVTVS